MAEQPLFVSSWKTATAKISTANTAINGTGTITDIATFGASGGFLDCVNIKAEQATTTGMVRLWLKKSSTYYLLDEILLSSAITPSATVRTFQSTVYFGRKFNASDVIAASTEKAESFAVEVHYGDY